MVEVACSAVSPTGLEVEVFRTVKGLKVGGSRDWDEGL